MAEICHVIDIISEAGQNNTFFFLLELCDSCVCVELV